jgi:hypothetical protein
VGTVVVAIGKCSRKQKKQKRPTIEIPDHYEDAYKVRSDRYQLQVAAGEELV